MDAPKEENKSSNQTESTMVEASNPIFFPHPSSPEDSHKDCIYSILLTPTHLITASKDQTIRVWSLATQRLAQPPLEGHTASVLCLAAIDSKNLLFSGSVDARLIVWDMKSWKYVRVIEEAHEESILSIAASDHFIVTGGKDKRVKVWDVTALGPSSEPLQSVDPISILIGHAAAVNAVVIQSDKIIVTASGDRSIRVWNLETKTRLRTFQGGFVMGIACLALFPDGKQVVAGGSDKSARIFDVETGAEEACLRMHTNLVRSVCVIASKHGNERNEAKVVTAGYDGKIHVWGRMQDVERTWEIQRTVSSYQALPEDTPERGIESAFKVFKVLSDGQKIFCANTSSRIIAWDL